MTSRVVLPTITSVGGHMYAESSFRSVRDLLTEMNRLSHSESLRILAERGIAT